MTPPKLMLLHPDDNVLVCIAPIAAGERVVVGDVELQAIEGIDVGHKLARRPIAPGEGHPQVRRADRLGDTGNRSRRMGPHAQHEKRLYPRLTTGRRSRETAA